MWQIREEILVSSVAVTYAVVRTGWGPAGWRSASWAPAAEDRRYRLLLQTDFDEGERNRGGAPFANLPWAPLALKPACGR